MSEFCEKKVQNAIYVISAVVEDSGEIRVVFYLYLLILIQIKVREHCNGLFEKRGKWYRRRAV